MICESPRYSSIANSKSIALESHAFAYRTKFLFVYGDPLLVGKDTAMTNTLQSLERSTVRSAREAQPISSVRFDWAMVALSGAVVGGAHLDAWAHDHGRV